MTEFLGNMYSWFTFIPKITLSNLFEILMTNKVNVAIMNGNGGFA